MLFRQKCLDGIREGIITVAFRRWRRPSVRAGGTLLTPVGQLAIVSVEEVTMTEITEPDARRAGYDSREELVDELRSRSEGKVYRIALGTLRADPRVALRRSATLGDAQHREIATRLERLDDRSPDGPWTRRTLDLIRTNPGLRAGDLCRLAGQDKLQFKVNVRKLKTLGLTESLEIGYRLSPRGAAWLARAVVLCLVMLSISGVAAAQQPPDVPAVTVRGQTYTPRSILARNMGSDEDQTTAFPPHKVVGNIYYVGTRTLSSFLITTPAGHILINSTYERNVPTIAKSVEQLGFKFSDVRILLGTHAHGDHQEGDALVKEMTGAQVMAMREDVPALEGIRPNSKTHPIDRQLRDGEEVSLGGTTLTAHLTAGHTRGCTTWTMKATEGGKTLNVVFACSYRAPGNVTPEIEAEFIRTFKTLRTLPCDVPLGDHPAQYSMTVKHATIAPGRPNPFIDAASCWNEAEIQEAMLRAQLELQRKAGK